MYKNYGVIFWNEETDEEVKCYINASGYFDAEDVLVMYEKEGWIKGTLHFISEGQQNLYTIDFQKFAQKVNNYE